MSSHDPRLLIGLGSAAPFARVTVRWPSAPRPGSSKSRPIRRMRSGNRENDKPARGARAQERPLASRERNPAPPGRAPARRSCVSRMDRSPCVAHRVGKSPTAPATGSRSVVLGPPRRSRGIARGVEARDRPKSVSERLLRAQIIKERGKVEQALSELEGVPDSDPDAAIIWQAAACSNSNEIMPVRPRRPCCTRSPRTQSSSTRGAGSSICMPSWGEEMI